MSEGICLDRRSDNPTACLQKLVDFYSRMRIQALWLVDY